MKNKMMKITKITKMAICIVLSIVLLAGMGAGEGVFADPIPTNSFAITYNGEPFILQPGDGNFFIDNQNRTQCPARAMAQKMGFSVEWDNNTRKVTIKGENKEIILTVNSSVALVDGKKVELDSSVFLKASEGRVYIPLRFVAENMDCTVQYQLINQIHTIAITSKGGVIATTASISGLNILTGKDPLKMVQNVQTIANTLPSDSVSFESNESGASLLYGGGRKPHGYNDALIVVISDKINDFELCVRANTWTVQGLKDNAMAKDTVDKVTSIIKAYLPTGYTEVLKMYDYSATTGDKYFNKIYTFDHRQVEIRANGDIYISFYDGKLSL